MIYMIVLGRDDICYFVYLLILVFVKIINIQEYGGIFIELFIEIGVMFGKWLFVVIFNILLFK